LGEQEQTKNNDGMSRVKQSVAWTIHKFAAKLTWLGTVIAANEAEAIRRGVVNMAGDMDIVDWRWFKAHYIVKYGSVRNKDGTDLPWNEGSPKLGHKRHAHNNKVEIRLLDINGEEIDRREHLIAEYWRSKKW
jgi:hypothetical protein